MWKGRLGHPALRDGDPLIRDLRKADIFAVPFDPARIGNKEERGQKISYLIEGRPV